jgi:5-formyltetrahydrofolate cyclo-ligase
MPTFDTKADARQWVWSTLRDEGLARFPFPVEGRIPNYTGAKDAAHTLLDSGVFEGVEALKSNPDSPQKYVRELALRHGITVFVPTPRLKGGFQRFDPDQIPKEHYEDASMLSRWDRWAEQVGLEELPQVDLIVTGCVAVTRDGRRCGKGEGYSDLEYAMLQELGHEPAPVVTTVHDRQIVDGFPIDDHDVGLSGIATPETWISVEDPPTPTPGIAWSKLSEADLEEMPILRQLR